MSNFLWAGKKPPFKITGMRVTEKRGPLLRGTIVSLTRWFPLLEMPGYEHRGGVVEVWCPYCQRYHRHGWSTWQDGRFASNRSPHCGNPEETFDSGYYISVWRKKDPGYSGHVIKPGTLIFRKARANRRPPDGSQTDFSTSDTAKTFTTEL